MSNVNGSRDLMERFGFVFDEGGVHLARTMMLDDLSRTLEGTPELPSIDQFVSAIEDDNILGKRSAQTRKLAARHLIKLYGLDSSILLFRAFFFLWEREKEGRPLLCLLMAYSRDSILRSSRPFIFDLQPGAAYEREKLESFIEELWPGRFSKATLKSTAQNIAGTWTQSGHLKGRGNKTRQFVEATPASISFALLMGFIAGDRGTLLFECDYIKLLDCTATNAMELAEIAGRKNWVDFKRVGSVVEVTFPRFITREDLEHIRGQG